MMTAFFLLRPARGAFLAAAAVVLMMFNGHALAGEPAAAKPAAAIAGGGDFALTARSAFDVPADSARNPFLPIGYVRPTSAAPASQQVVFEVKPEQFVVTSFSLDPPPLAVINGRTYGLGDRVPVGAAGTGTGGTGGDFVVVRQITDGAVLLDHHGRLLRCLSRLRGK